MRGGYWIVFIVLVALGLYFLVWHSDPLPANHETVGLGDQHIVHSVFGIVLLAGAFLVRRQSRRVVSPARP
ncbi:MAG: hypothetical protein AABY08_05475, partial [Candidatus Thermoplasmatota archaeon]|jgi:hypothetical protein